MKENLLLREKNQDLLLQLAEYRKRSTELNQLVTDLISTRKTSKNADLSFSNLNEQQISYGRSSIVESPDAKLRKSSDEVSAEEDPVVKEHLKQTLKVYLSKQPVFDPTNELVLSTIYSLLNFTQSEISELTLKRE